MKAQSRGNSRRLALPELGVPVERTGSRITMASTTTTALSIILAAAIMLSAATRGYEPDVLRPNSVDLARNSEVLDRDKTGTTAWLSEKGCTQPLVWQAFAEVGSFSGERQTFLSVGEDSASIALTRMPRVFRTDMNVCPPA